jgi:hypothetical protein
VGDVAKIRSSIEALKIAKVDVVDMEGRTVK